MIICHHNLEIIPIFLPKNSTKNTTIFFRCMCSSALTNIQSAQNMIFSILLFFNSFHFCYEGAASFLYSHPSLCTDSEQAHSNSHTFTNLPSKFSSSKAKIYSYHKAAIYTSIYTRKFANRVLKVGAYNYNRVIKLTVGYLSSTPDLTP